MRESFKIKLIGYMLQGGGNYFGMVLVLIILQIGQIVMLFINEKLKNKQVLVSKDFYLECMLIRMFENYLERFFV